MEHSSVIIPTKILKSMIKWASKDSTRANLGGIGVTSLGELCAADGHTLVVAHEYKVDPGFSEWYWPIPAIKVAMARSVDRDTALSTEDLIRGFPPVMQCVPASFVVNRTEPFAFNPAYTARMSDFVDKGKGVTCVHMPSDVLEPLFFQIPGKFTFVIMPMRV